MAQVLQTYWQSAHFALLLPRTGKLHTQMDARINDLFSAQNRQILRARLSFIIHLNTTLPIKPVLW